MFQHEFPRPVPTSVRDPETLSRRPASSQSALAHRDADAKPPMLLVVDARSPLAVKGNQIAGGKGTETLEHYEGVRISVLWP